MRDSKKIKGEIEIYMRIVVAGVISCDHDSFLEHLGQD